MSEAPKLYQTVGGYFVGETVADPDPMRPGRWLIPGGCVAMPPPMLAEGQRARWDGRRWCVETAEAPPPEPIRAPRAADPLEKLARFLAANPDVAALLPKD